MLNFSPKLGRIQVLFPLSSHSPSGGGRYVAKRRKSSPASPTRRPRMLAPPARLRGWALAPVLRSPAPPSAPRAPARAWPGRGRSQASAVRARAAPPSVASEARRVATQCKLGKGDELGWLRRGSERGLLLRLVGHGPWARSPALVKARLAPKVSAGLGPGICSPQADRSEPPFLPPAAGHPGDEPWPPRGWDCPNLESALGGRAQPRVSPAAHLWLPSEFLWIQVFRPYKVALTIPPPSRTLGPEIDKLPLASVFSFFC